MDPFHDWPDSKRGVKSSRSSRFDETDVYPSHSSRHRVNGAAGPSRVRQEPIIIDDDDDEDEIYAKPMATKARRTSRETPRDVENGDNTGGIDQFEAREAVRVALTKLDTEMKDVRAQIEPLQALLVSLESERKQLESQLSPRPSTSDTNVQSKSLPSRASAVDYRSSSFPWSPSLVPLLRKTFDIPSFRLCQEGVVNAAIDGRDIVCVMPTGGGKSLTYQLPAVMGKRGLTVVISPLLALIWDQVRAMKEIGVESVMLTGSTSKEDQNAIFRSLEKGDDREIRLCYLTPEKISKSKRLLAVLQKANAAGRLRRFVIDEAHCCSQLGHDFRPDYKQLSVLKSLFPRVPIQAVTATLSTKTLPDLLKILRLGPICDGRQANATGTVFFTAPLYRPNLRYKVLSKPSSAKAAIAVMGEWIQENHANESGIIYCLSKKDAETVADALKEWSEGQIKTGVYHAGVDDYMKERIHIDWREGKINCICATIAFGMGIDKGDVRYVIHHSMSKSLDGYYQETGRAGRDGKESDCILFYRGQDASRLTGLVYSDVDGMGKLQEMTRFAQDLTTCRKIAFAKYFSTSANLSANAWDNAATLDADRGGTLTTCGTCDNCTRDEGSVITRDVTLDTWKLLKVLEVVQQEGGRVTIGGLADLARGLRKGEFDVMGGKKRKAVGTASLDVGDVAGGKVELGKDDTERLMISLVLMGYLAESYSATAYSVNIYLVPGRKAFRLSRLGAGQVQDGQASIIECTFLQAVKRGGGKKRSRKEIVDLSGGEEEAEGKGEEGVDVDEVEAWDPEAEIRYAEDYDDDL